MEQSPNSKSALPQEIRTAIDKKFNKPGGLIPSGEVRFSGSLGKWYQKVPRIEVNDWHRILESLAVSVPGFKVEYQPAGFDELPILKRLVVEDSGALLDAIGIPVLSEKVAAEISLVLSALETAPAWLQKALAGLADAWQEDKGIRRITVNKADALLHAIQFLKWLDLQNDLAIDMRTASVKALNDSKLLERQTAFIADLLRLHPTLGGELSDDQTAEDILSQFGISRFSPLLRIKGNCQLSTKTGNINIDCATPYLAMPLESLLTVEQITPAPYILLIENLASFERYCREIDESGITVFTSGFPSRKWRKILKPLCTADVQVFHWGDIDVGGYRILALLNQEFDGRIQPFRMSVRLATKTSDLKQALDTAQMKDAIAPHWNAACASLVKDIESLEKTGSRIAQFEQESLDPQPPIVGHSLTTEA